MAGSTFVGFRSDRDGELHVLHNEGRRAFLPLDVIHIDRYAIRLVARDLNGDGVPDLATGASFLIGNGDGTFQAPRTFSLDAEDFALVDLDRDGLPDLVLTQRENPFLRVVMNTSR